MVFVECGMLKLRPLFRLIKKIIGAYVVYLIENYIVSVSVWAVVSIQSVRADNLVYTPGYIGLAQPFPHETTPTSFPFTVIGPPESP
jgi:hypothetical protein